MNYCYIYGDSDEKNLYLEVSDKIKVDYCPTCKMVLNREEAIMQAVKIVKIRKKKFFFTSLDGVSIASRRFFEIYNQYNMKGIEFIPLERSEGYYVCKFVNIMKFDVEQSKSIRIEYQGKVSYGVLDNGKCAICQRSFGHHYPFPYRMIVEDEGKLEQNTFYRSDIEFEEKIIKALFYGLQMVLFRHLQKKNAEYSTKMWRDILERATVESREKLPAIALQSS